MSGRMTLGSLFVLAVLIPGICQAQSGYGYGPNGPPGAGGAAGQLSAQDGNNQAQQLSPLQLVLQAQAQTVTPGTSQDEYSVGPQPQPAPATTFYEQLPDDPGFLYDQSPVDQFFTNTFKHAFFRGEYLLWSATGTGGGLLGQTPASGFLTGTLGQPIAPNTFTTSNPITGNAATAIDPSTAGFNLNNLNGYRGTIGVPVGPGQFELNAWILGLRTNAFNGTGLITQEVTTTNATGGTTTTPANFIGQPVTVDGGQTTMLYTNSYLATMQTMIWGTEANYIFDAANSGIGDAFTISPLVGFRYLNYRETLSQGGEYTYVSQAGQIPPATATAERQILAQSNNHLYGPQLGLRLECSAFKCVIGAEPKIMVGVNTYDASLNTVNVPASNPAANTNYNFLNTSTIFSPIADFKVYARFPISQYVNVYAAYNYMWVGQLSRPYNNIGYNFDSSGAGLFNTSFTNSVIQGLSVGGEIRY